MRKILMSVVLAMTPAVAACDLTPPVSVSQGTLLDEKALYTAEASYNTVAKSYLDVVDDLAPATKAKVKPVMLKAYDSLLVLRTAYRAGDAAKFNAQLLEFNKLVKQAKELL